VAERRLPFDATFDPTIVLADKPAVFPNTGVLVHPSDVVDLYAYSGFGDAVTVYSVCRPNAPLSEIHPRSLVAAYANVEFDDALVTMS
jgi:hypothetical protein